MRGTSLKPLLHSSGNLRVSHAKLSRANTLPFYMLAISRQNISNHIGTTRFMHNVQIQLS